MEIDRSLYAGQNQQDTATELILKRKAIRYDREGNVMHGEYPNDYFTQTPGYFNKDATLANKNANDLHYDYQHNLIQNRLIRESIPDEAYTVEHLIKEFDREYSAVNLDTMNKEGKNNNRALFVTSFSESTNKTIELPAAKKGGLLGLGLFARK